MPDSPPVSAAAGSSLPLARGVARGDPAALEAFYRLWFDRVYLAVRRLSNRDEAFCLDVVQEVMLKVARKLRPMRTEQELEAWMATVVRSTAIDLLRREQRRKRREHARMVVSAEQVSTPAGPAKEEMLEWVQQQVATLPTLDQNLITGRIVRQQTLEQVAAANGLSVNAAHGRVRRAVQKLGRAARELFHE